MIQRTQGNKERKGINLDGARLIVICWSPDTRFPNTKFFMFGDDQLCCMLVMLLVCVKMMYCCVTPRIYW